MRLAGLLGPEIPAVLLRQLVGSSAAYHGLLDDGVVEEQPGHDICRVLDPATCQEQVRAAPPAQLRSDWEEIAAAAVALRLPEDSVARSWTAAGQAEKARKWWIRAAEKACLQKDYRCALDSLGNALTDWPWSEEPGDRIRILREMARCALNAGEPRIAADRWRELAEYAADTGNMPLRVEALGQLARLTDDGAACSALLKEAADTAAAHLAPAQAIRPLLDYVDNLASRVRISLAGEVIDRAARLAKLSGDPAMLSEVRGWQGLVAAMAGDHSSAGRLVAESLQVAVENDLPEQAALAYRRRANIADYCSDYGLEVSSHRHAIQYCQENRAGDQLSCFSCLAYACFRTGDWPSALQSAKAVLDDPAAHPALRGMADCVTGLIAAYRGERSQALERLERALMRIRRDGMLGMEFFALTGRAWLDVLDGRPEDATRRFDDIRSLWRETEDLHDVLHPLLFAGGHYARAGHPDRLLDCIEILNTILARNPVSEARATHAALMGEKALTEGDREGFVAGMESAGTCFSKAGLPLEQVWTCVRAASEGGLSLRSSGHALARKLGLRPFLAMLEEPSAGAVPCDLPPRLREVLGFLAAGLTSKEMADRLSLSTRTVEMHVARLLKRLNCRTRPEAVRVATERGWIP